MKDLLSLLRQEDFRFNMRGWSGDAARFFAPTDRNRELLAERRRWAEENRDDYLGATTPALNPLLELAELAGEWCQAGIEGDGEPLSVCERLSNALEPDFILLAEGTEGRQTAVAGAVCFPSSWSFREALGKPLGEIHSIVPGLNESIGKSIEALLRRLGPGESWERFNWGISLSPERNQHPTRALPRLAEATTVERAWLRAEWQVLFKLPRTGAVLFGIRVIHIGLEELKRQPGAAEAVARQLDTMPPAMREYKGLGRNLHLLDPWLG